MKKLIQIITIVIIMITNSCSNENLIKFYYPLNQEPAVRIYKYINPENRDLTEYWKVTTDPIHRIILTESFDSKFNLYNTFEEKIEGGNAELLRYIEYEQIGGQNTKELKAKIKENQVFKSSKSESYSYLVEYKNKYGKIIFEKKRQFVKFEEIEIEKKKYKTAKFRDEYLFKAIDRDEKYIMKQHAYYVKGIGMIKYERFLPTGEKRVLELAKILIEKDFEQIKQAMNN